MLYRTCGVVCMRNVDNGQTGWEASDGSGDVSFFYENVEGVMNQQRDELGGPSGD